MQRNVMWHEDKSHLQEKRTACMLGVGKGKSLAPTVYDYLHYYTYYNNARLNFNFVHLSFINNTIAYRASDLRRIQFSSHINIFSGIKKFLDTCQQKHS